MTGALHGGSGWQTVLADLSLILFMVCASALSTAPAWSEPAEVPNPPRSGPPAPLAIYRADPGAPPLDQWLRDQAADPRQRLTIVATYAGGGRAAAAQQADGLARASEAAGFDPRVIIEPGPAGQATVGLAFEGAEPSVTPDRPPLLYRPTAPAG